MKPKREAEQILHFSVESSPRVPVFALVQLGNNWEEQLSLTFVAAVGGSGALVVIAGLACGS